MNAEQLSIATEVRETLERAAADYLELAIALEGLWIKVDGLGRVYWHLPEGYMIASISTTGRPMGMELTKERADSARLAVFTTRLEAERGVPCMETFEGYSYFMEERRRVLESLEWFPAQAA